MTRSERKQLAVVRNLLTQVTDGLAKKPIDRGQALGAALDARDIVEEMTAEKGD